MFNGVGYRTFTLNDCIERSLKKGGVDEKCAAAELATVLCVQLGTDPVGEDICRILKPILLTIAFDNSASPKVRAHVRFKFFSLEFLVLNFVCSVVKLLETCLSCLAAILVKTCY